VIQLSLAEASHRLDYLRDQSTRGDTVEIATLTEDGKPVLAVMPWELYEAFLEMVHIPTNPHTLLQTPARTRQRVLAIVAARAENLYRTDPDLTDFEAFGENDLYDGTE
jgi:hypothetical protein